MARFRLGFLIVVFAGSAMLLDAGASASEQPTPANPESGSCLACHTRTSPADGPRGPEVDNGDFAWSPHATLGCRRCHPGIDPAAHPAVHSATAAATIPCRTCHTRIQLAEKPIHGILVELTDAPPCTECHVPHRMRRVADWKPRASVTMYCLTCHQRQLTVSLDGAEPFRLSIVEIARGRNVHLQHQCPDCHEEFSKLDHPVRERGDRTGYRRAFAARCASCHLEEARLFAGGLHYRLLEKGHPEAPACTDCHGFHEIASVAEYRVLTGQPCRRCHAEVFAQFRESRHSRSGAERHLELPLCSTCHRAHNLAYETLVLSVNETCLDCHTDAASRHRLWLPQAETHFESVSCTMCHAPSVAGAMTITILDTRSGRNVTRAEVSAIVGKAYAPLLADKTACSTDLALWSELVFEMNRREGRGRRVYTFRLGTPGVGAAHRLGGREEACRECARCHRQCLDLNERDNRGWRFPR